MNKSAGVCEIWRRRTGGHSLTHPWVLTGHVCDRWFTGVSLVLGALSCLLGLFFSSIKEDKAEDRLKYWVTSSVGVTNPKYPQDSG